MYPVPDIGEESRQRGREVVEPVSHGQLAADLALAEPAAQAFEGLCVPLGVVVDPEAFDAQCLVRTGPRSWTVEPASDW